MLKQYLIGLLTLEALAFITAFFPGMSGIFFILYFVLFMGITALLTGRAAKRTLSDLKYVSGGVKLYEEGKESISKIKERDYMLRKELSVQTKAMLLQMLTFVIFMVIVFMPNLRDAIVYGVGGYFKGLLAHLTDANLRDKIALFIGYQTIYLGFFVTSIATTTLSSNYLRRKGHQNLMISSHYLVTDRGIIVDGRLPIKFPIDVSKVKVNAPRRFVELEVGEAPAAGGLMGGAKGTSRVRLYASKPKELASIIKKYSQEAI